MIVGPWGHTDESSSRLGDHDFGKEAALDLQSLYLRWFDFWLKGIDNKITQEPLVQLFTMFSNQWLKADTYPLPQTQFTKYYLSSQSGANSSKGDGKLGSSLPTGVKSMISISMIPVTPHPVLSIISRVKRKRKKRVKLLLT